MDFTRPAKNFLRLPTDHSINPDVRQNFRRNIIANTLDGIIWMLGDSFVSIYTILPVFASTLTDSAIIIGLVPALMNAGWFLPQLLMAGYIKRLPQKMPFAKIMCIVERIPYIFLPLTAFLIPYISKDWAVIFFVLVIAWRGFAGGMVALPWQEVIASVIPSPVRSRFFGVSRTLGRIMGVIGSAITTLILARFTYPNNYGISFLIGGIFIWISLFFFIQTKEPKKVTTSVDERPVQKLNIWDDFRSYKHILKNDSNIVRYLASRILFQSGNMAVAFLAVFGLQRFQLPDEQAAIFSGLLFFSGTLGFVLLSLVGDWLGARLTLLISDILQAIVILLAFISPGVWAIYVLFFILGFAQSGYIIGELILGMELGPEEDRAIYIGLVRSLPGIFILTAPLLGGLLVEQLGYRSMFVIALALSVLGIIVMLGVKDPHAIKKTKIKRIL
jgi:MFS family permease